MKSLKKIIRRYMQIITLIMVIVVLFVIVGIQMATEQRRAQKNAMQTLYQIEQVLAENQEELIRIGNEYRHTCLCNADAIAYIVEQNPFLLERSSMEELRKIAAFMEVDEIHIFDKEGTIIAGTKPEHYGLSMDSGEQIHFFKPLLQFKTLKLVQDVTPNTAEHKLMQYSALWSKNGEFILQVGMEPTHVMEATQRNELSYIFSLFRVDTQGEYYAIDVESGKIVGSTDTDSVGKEMAQIGIEPREINDKMDGFHASINGVPSYCIFEQIDSNYVGYVMSDKVLYERIPRTALIITICLILIACMLVYAVTWYMNRYVLGGIYTIIEKLRSLARGNQDEIVDVDTSEEFSELSSYINEMVKSLLDNNKRLSYVLSKTNMYIGAYEYNTVISTVNYTECIPKILDLDEEKTRELFYNRELFCSFIQKLKENNIPEQHGVYRLPGDEEHYVRLEEIKEEDVVFGVVIDVTDEVCKLHKVVAERDQDILTGLYNRRGMETNLSRLFSEPEKLGYAALIMIDADGLKEINDTYGHESGDLYLKQLARTIKETGTRKSLAIRQGGDEFVLFLYGYDNEEELMKSILNLENKQSREKVTLHDDEEVLLRFSLGFSVVSDEYDYTKLLKEADAKMYGNKKERKRKAASATKEL